MLSPALTARLEAPVAKARLAELATLDDLALLDQGLALAPTAVALADILGMNQTSLSRVRRGHTSFTAYARDYLRVYVALDGVDVPVEPRRGRGARPSPGTGQPRLRLPKAKLARFQRRAATVGLAGALASAIELYMVQHKGTEPIPAPTLPVGTAYVRVRVAPDLLAKLEARTEASDRASHLHAAVTAWLATPEAA